jgi:multidrug efflux pump subunit AcrA (membrane-fusion protein)
MGMFASSAVHAQALSSGGISASIGDDFAAELSEANPRILHANSMPSEKHRVSFEGNSDGTPVIKEVLVKPGDMVKKGDILMTEDTELAEAQAALLKAASEAVGAIDHAQYAIAAKSVIVTQIEGLSLGNTTPRDLTDAKLDRDEAIAEKEKAVEDQSQEKLAYQRQLLKIDHMKLHSPIDGVVEKIGLFAGETVDSNSEKDGAVYVISNQPLFIEIPLRADLSAKLKLHDKVDVAFPDKADQWLGSEVIFIDPTVEPASQTQWVRLSLDNPDNRPSGLNMAVRLPDKVWADHNSPAAASAVGSVDLAKP